MLITVSGVGPKAAIAILSHMTPQKLAIAIIQDDKKAISKANGIGPKTAARIVLELKDKLKKENISLTDDTGVDEPIITTINDTSKLGDAQKALMVLGYSKSEAISALSGIDQNLELDDMIRLALKKLMR
jgi:Holliday junction DNA helicase RuvA